MGLRSTYFEKRVRFSKQMNDTNPPLGAAAAEDAAEGGARGRFVSKYIENLCGVNITQFNQQ